MSRMTTKKKSSFPKERNGNKNHPPFSSIGKSAALSNKRRFRGAKTSPLPETDDLDEVSAKTVAFHDRWEFQMTVAVTFAFVAFVTAVTADVLQADTLYVDTSANLHITAVILFGAGIMSTHFVGNRRHGHVASLFGTQNVKKSFTVQVYQFFSVVLFVVALGLSWTSFHTTPTHFGILTAAAVAAFLSHILLVSSLLAYEKPKKNRFEEGKASLLNILLGGRGLIQLHNYMNLLLVMGAFFLAISSEFSGLHFKSSYTLYAIAGSVALFITAFLNTYGLGGTLSYPNRWNFWQPMQGGAKFIGLQIASWALFCTSIALQFMFLLSMFVVEFELVVGITIIAGVLCVLSQMLMVVSLHVFKNKDEDRLGVTSYLYAMFVANREFFLVAILSNIAYVIPSFIFILFLCLPGVTVQDAIVSGGLSFLCMFSLCVTLSSVKQMYYRDAKISEVNKYSLKYWIPIMIVGSAPLLISISYRDTPQFISFVSLTTLWYTYVLTTFTGQPEVSGSRMRRDLIDAPSFMANTVSDYFSAKIIRTSPLNPQQTYVMSFHPHGIIPLTVMWIQMSDAWKRLFPGIYACPLTASALQLVPGMRDIAQIYGAREVTREAFCRALQEQQSVILVPGGQAEMIESRSGRRQMRVYSGHKGFLRIAMQHGCSVVPILSFQEAEILDNIYLPRIQRWFVRHFAVPFPFLPYGSWFAPVPRRVPLTVVVGEPISVPSIENPTSIDVEKLHTEYYTALTHLFEKHKHEAQCPDHELILI